MHRRIKFNGAADVAREMELLEYKESSSSHVQVFYHYKARKVFPVFHTEGVAPHHFDNPDIVYLFYSYVPMSAAAIKLKCRSSIEFYLGLRAFEESFHH